MKRLLGIFVSAIALTAAAQADPFTTYYGNTLTIDGATGKVVNYINADKTWQTISNGKVEKGTYEVKGETLVCFTLSDPAPADPAKATSCNPVKPNPAVGSTWTDIGPGGKPATYTLTAGR